MLSTLVVFVVGAVAYLALSFLVSVVVGSMLRGADGSLAAPARRTPGPPARQEGVLLPAVPAPAVGPHGRTAPGDDPAVLLPRSLRGRCRRATMVGVAPLVPLVRRLR